MGLTGMVAKRLFYTIRCGHLYYLPVKFRELAKWLIEYWKLYPEKLQTDIMTQMVEAEYAQIPESERDGWA